MDYIQYSENKSIYVIREAYAKIKNMALLWSMGKDSSTLLHMCRKAFMGKIPFPVLHIDTGYKFKEMYEFRDRVAREWNLDLRVAKSQQALDAGMGPNAGQKLDCCGALKTAALQKAVADCGFSALLVGIRRDEHGIRAKERYFSPRDGNFSWDYKNQPAELWDQYVSIETDGVHYRVHPLLHMTELDIWNYIKRENIPLPSLYFAKDGKRYRSIGCEPCCMPVDSNAVTLNEIIEELRVSETSERDGRAQDKEDVNTMQMLRSLGYM